jgi:hypothetical protein
MAAIIGIAAAWPWSAVLAFAFVSYASRIGDKLRSHRDAVDTPDKTARNEIPPRGIDPTLDLASLMYDHTGKITLSRLAYVVNLGSFLAALILLVPLPNVTP